jgi:hypothetical protein
MCLSFNGYQLPLSLLSLIYTPLSLPQSFTSNNTQSYDTAQTHSLPTNKSHYPSE